MIVNVKDTPEGLLIIVCDEELIGQKLEENTLQLDLNLPFYKGEQKTAIETADLMRNADHLHLVGERSVALGIEEKLVDPTHIITIQGVPHAEVTRL